MVNPDFEMAMRAFELFTMDERLDALEQFAELRYPSIPDRFYEAVHRVITKCYPDAPPRRSQS